jgi:hypothetical protein
MRFWLSPGCFEPSSAILADRLGEIVHRAYNCSRNLMRKINTMAACVARRTQMMTETVYCDIAALSNFPEVGDLLAHRITDQHSQQVDPSPPKAAPTTQPQHADTASNQDKTAPLNPLLDACPADVRSIRKE